MQCIVGALGGASSRVPLIDLHTAGMADYPGLPHTHTPSSLMVSPGFTLRCHTIKSISRSYPPPPDIYIAASVPGYQFQISSRFTCNSFMTHLKS